MADIVKITKGQPFVVYVPLVILNADGSKETVDASSINDVIVTISCGCEKMEMPYSPYLHYMVLSFEEGLQIGEYSIVISATLDTGRQFSLRINRAFGIVAWDWQSNWEKYLVGDHIELTDQPFIAGSYITDEEYERLHNELREKIKATEQVKAQYETKLHELQDIATETNATANKNENLTAIQNVRGYLGDLWSYIASRFDSIYTNLVNNFLAEIKGRVLGIVNQIDAQTNQIINTTNAQGRTIVEKIASNRESLSREMTAQVLALSTTLHADRDSIITNANEHAAVFSKQGNNDAATNTAILNAVENVQEAIQMIVMPESATDAEIDAMTNTIIAE